MSARSFRFDPGAPIPDEVRRVARGRIDHALDELRGESDSTREEAVHEARKDMKKLRALLRLVRGELGDRVYAFENTCFRDTARELSGVRDADVMLVTLGDLEERYGELPGAGGRLRPALVAHRFRTSAGSLHPAKAAVDTLAEAARPRRRLAARDRRLRGVRGGAGADLPPGPPRLPRRPEGPDPRAHARVAQAGEGPLVPPAAAPGQLEAGDQRAGRRGARAVGPARRRARPHRPEAVGAPARERAQRHRAGAARLRRDPREPAAASCSRRRSSTAPGSTPTSRACSWDGSKAGGSRRAARLRPIARRRRARPRSRP